MVQPRHLPPVVMLSVLPVVLGCVICSPAEGQWSVEAFGGTAVSANSPLTIHQDDYPTLRLDAEWDTRPFEPTIYYAVRIARWWGGNGVFLNNIHHKLYLANPTTEVPRFEVTYGYNLLAAGPAFRRGEWSLLAGAGPILANPASVVRGRSHLHSGGFFGTGYHLDGVHLQAGVNRRVHVAQALFLSADLLLSAGWAKVDIANGKADVPNYAVHFLFGLGVGNRRRQGD